MPLMGKLLTRSRAIDDRAILKKAGKTLVFTNGHFDLLHIGHLDYLEKARALGDALYVGVNGDAVSRMQKGPGRPIVPVAERARLLSALCCVDAAIIFEEPAAFWASPKRFCCPITLARVAWWTLSRSPSRCRKTCSILRSAVTSIRR